MLEYKARITSHDNLKAELPEAIKGTITSSNELQELLRGRDAGRYLGRAKRIHPDFNGNYILEKEDSWRTAKEGDYVYLVGDLSNRGGDKDTYYIVRERKSSTVWEEYNIKGHSPSPEELKAGIEGSEKIKSLEVDVRDAKQTATTSAQEVAGFGQELVRTKGLAQASYELSNDANASAADLSARSLTADQRDEVAYLTSSLPQLRSADGKTKLQGLSLQRYITLSSDGDNISAYLASDALTAVLKAGITNFGTPEEKENVAINHNGTGHFGNLYFEGNQIDFRIDQKTDPYLSVGAEEADFIDNFINSARVDNTPVSIRSTALPDRNKLPDSSAYTLVRTLSVANEGTRLTISIDNLKVETYKPNKAYLVLDGVVLDTWQGHISTGIARLPDGTVEANPTPVPYTASNLIYERTVAKGTHMIQIILESPNSSDKVTLSGVKVRQRYDTGLQQSLLTKSGLRLYGSPDRYLDVDYRKQYYNTARGIAVGWVTNPYTLRVKGGAKIDRLEVDKITGAGAKLSPIVTPQLSWGGQSTIYPKYDDWVLTSDAKAQYISFSGLTAEVGRSIYIQTRRKAYLYANNHSFYGLPGDASKGTAVDQWLANNTTYRFVRASSDSWFVTASSSPYPWT